jgi:peptidyl-prolyl cis-trans isomerase C
MWPLRLALVALIVALATVTGTVVRPAAAEDTRSAVVARVGPRAITADELEARIRSLPAVQRAALGKTEDDIRRAVLERLVIPDVLHELGARVHRLDEDPAVKLRILTALRTARVERMKADLQTTSEELLRYYEANRSQFESPARLGLWRILCATPEEAQVVLDKARAGMNAWGWKDLSHERSIDKATKYRGGDLGFVAADGSSSEPSLKVDPGLFAAASKVQDGDLVPEPVPEGDAFAVVWRRESMPAVVRTLDEEAPSIRQVLLRRKLELAVRELVQALRSHAAVESRPQLTELIEVDSLGQVAPRPRASLVPRPSSGPSVPSHTVRGVR